MGISLKKVWNSVSKPFKNVLHGINKFVKKGLKNPLIRTIAIAAAAYFLAPLIAPMILSGVGGLGLSAAASTVVADVAVGALTGAIVNGGAAAIEGKGVGKAAVTGGITGGVMAGAAGAMGSHASSLGQKDAVAFLNQPNNATEFTDGLQSTVPQAPISGIPQPVTNGLQSTVGGSQPIPTQSTGLMGKVSDFFGGSGTSAGDSSQPGAISNWYNGLGETQKGLVSTAGVTALGQGISGLGSGYAAGKATDEQQRQFDIARQDQLNRYNDSQPGMEQLTPADQLALQTNPMFANQSAINPAANLNGLMQGYTNPNYAQLRTV